MESVVKRGRPGARVAVFVAMAALVCLALFVAYGAGSSRSDRPVLGSDLAVEESVSDDRGATTTTSVDVGGSSSTTEEAPATTEPPAIDDDRPQAEGGLSTGVDGEVRSYTMEGGEIVLAFLEDEVQLVSVTLNDGFTVETHEVGNELHVNLRDGVKHSAVVAWVEDGPQIFLDDH